MKALDRYLEERDAEDTLLELLADGIREANGEQPRPILRVVGEDENDMAEVQTVTSHDWLHGLVTCPNCGLPIDDRDRDKTRSPAGEVGNQIVRGRHERCGTEFELRIVPGR